MRRLGLQPPRTARADAAMQRHPRHVRLDLGYLDPVVALQRHLRHRRHIGRAMLAVCIHHVALSGRAGMQRPMRARKRLALGLARPLARRLVALARRRAGIVRVFGGRPSLASSSPTRRRSSAFSTISASTRASNVPINASFSALVSEEKSRGGLTRPLIQIRCPRATKFSNTESIRRGTAVRNETVSNYHRSDGRFQS